MEANWNELRKQMVMHQIKDRGITNQLILDAMLHVERHLFVPDDLRLYAYEDYPLPIDYNQTISQPYIVALMTELCSIDQTSRVLEIGTGSGYQTAILAELACCVFSVEIVCPLATSAYTLLSSQNYANIIIRCGDGYAGWSRASPFDAIIVTAAPEHVPPALIDQLAMNGRLVIPVGREFQQLRLIRKTSEGIVEENITSVRFVPMTGNVCA